MLIRLIVSLGFLIATSVCAVADTCVELSETCTSDQNVLVGDITISGACSKTKVVTECTRPKSDQCTAISKFPRAASAAALSSGQCTRLYRKCVRSVAGVCDKFELEFECLNGPLRGAPAKLLKRKFENFDETVERLCDPWVNDGCTLLDTRTFEQNATKTINGLKVKRAWWTRERSYDCTPKQYIDDCDSLDINPYCEKRDAGTCLGFGPNGECEWEQQAYDCQGSASFDASCEQVNVCVGDNCVGPDPEPSAAFPVAASWLTFLDEAAQGNNCEARTEPTAGGGSSLDDGCSLFDIVLGDCETSEPTSEGGIVGASTTNEELSFDMCSGTDGFTKEAPDVFSGERRSCNTTRGLINCCKRGGFECNDGDRLVRDAFKSGRSHYLKTDCVKTIVFGTICVKREHRYCIYNSKFARVFQEQAHRQIGGRFRPNSSPHCPALTIEQLESLDVEAMDFTEVFGQMIDDVDFPIEELLIRELQSDMGLFKGKASDVFQ